VKERVGVGTRRLGTFSMHPRAAELIADLALTPHPEGGYFREIHRSSASVRPDDDRTKRSAITVIYFC
jgi:predicted cupin superfamily sugar epimerase